MAERTLIDPVAAAFAQYRSLAERAAAQVDEAAFFQRMGADENSIAALCLHVGGNLRSRFTDFLTTDGEKPDRHRDAEFAPEGHARAEIEATWQDGWHVLTAALAHLSDTDLARTVYIRGHAHTVYEALLRSLAHVSYHTGQIVLLARHHAGVAWQTLSIAPGETAAFNARTWGPRGTPPRP